MTACCRACPPPALSQSARSKPHLSGFSLSRLPYKPSLSKMYSLNHSQSLLTHSQRQSFDLQKAQEWLDGLEQTHRDYFLKANLNTLVRVASSEGSQKFENMDSILEWVKFLLPQSPKIRLDHVEVLDLLKINPHMMEEIVPYLCPTGLSVALAVGVQNGYVSFVEKVAHFASGKIVSAQNSNILQMVASFHKHSPEKFHNLFNILLPKSSWKKAVKDLIHKGQADFSDVLLNHPSVPVHELEDVLRFAQHRKVLLPLAQVRYDRHVLTQSVQHATLTQQPDQPRRKL